MAVFLNDHIHPEPELLEAVKIVIKYEIQSLLSKLADTGEEYIVLTASTLDNSCGHIGSVKGEGFMKNSSVQIIKEEFLNFCTGDQLPQNDKIPNKENAQEESTIVVKKENPQTNRVRRRKSTPRCKSQPPEWQTQQELQEIQNYAMIDQPSNNGGENIVNGNVLDLSEKNIGGYSYTLDCSSDSYGSNVMSSSSEMSKYPCKEESPKHNGIPEEAMAYTWKEEKLPINVINDIGAPQVKYENNTPVSFANFAGKPIVKGSLTNSTPKKRRVNVGFNKVNNLLQSSQIGVVKQPRSRRKSKKIPIKVEGDLDSDISTMNSTNHGEANDNLSDVSGGNVNSNNLISNFTDITDMKSAFLEIGNMAKCLICLKVLANKNNRTFHWRSHVGDKRYTCDICNKAFTHPSNMRSHRKIHTDEKPFPCKLCERRFRRRDYLLQHLERFHYNPRSSEAPVMEESVLEDANVSQS